jgi:taurine dioxygenase
MDRSTIVADQDAGARLAAKRFRIEGLGWAGPATYLAPEDERLAGLTWEHFTVDRVGPTLGAELSGVDITVDLAPEVVAEIGRALADYKVIFFRDQPLTPERHVAFARCFGELEVHPFIPANSGQPELVRFEKSAEVAGYENSWHHDVTWRAIPSKAAVLHAISVPGVGGDTLFSDMCAAYDSLEDDVKERLEGLRAVHDFVRAFGAQVPEDRRAEMRATYPLVEHPVVVTHPVTGRKLLYVNRNFTERIVGLDADESTELLEICFAQAAVVEHQVRFRWRDDSVAMWDNLAVQHYASSDYWPHTRTMERASIVGTRPTA